MNETLKTHASLRGTNVVSDEAIQLRERLLAQSTHVALLTCKRYAFTMAEILLSLTIIGVVAAITLPSLMANINERTWNTQRKALYARLSQAIAMMPQVGGYGTLTEDESGSVTADTAAETFLTEGLSKVLKINNICDNEHLADCGVPTSYTNMVGNVKTWPMKVSEWNSLFVSLSYVGSGWNADGTDQYFSYSQIDTKAAAFETQSGETMVIYYNPMCKNNNTDIASSSLMFMCANFIYDLNGSKGPNSVGKDIGFMTALYNTDSSFVAPVPLSSNANGGAVIAQTAAGAACTTQDSGSRLPNIDELVAMFFNLELLGIAPARGFWSGTVVSSGDAAWHQSFDTASRNVRTRDEAEYVRCVKR